MVRKLVIPFLALGLLAMASCSQGGNEGEQMQGGDTLTNNFQKEQVRKILYTIPSPMAMASIIKSTGASFDKDMLNSTETISKYNTARQQALNLGIYGADLSYSTMFDQDQEGIQYLSAVQKMCSQLGIEGAIDGNIYERLNGNMDNRDSVLNIVSETYFSLDIYLKDAQREDLLALIIAGGWIEGLYLASQHLESGSAELQQRIAEQKFAVEDLTKLLESYGANENLNEIKADVLALKELYSTVQTTAANTATTKDENGALVIGGGSSFTMSPETLAKIVEKVREIRNKYIA